MNRILVVGDSCTDIFIYGDINRLSPEAPVPVFNPVKKVKNGGMTKNVVANLRALGCDVDIITNIGEIRKLRYVHIDTNQMIVRVDEDDNCEQINEATRMNICNNMYQGRGYDAIIISDYCKGFLSELDIELICKSNENVFMDTKKAFGSWAVHADFIKINSLEFDRNREIIPLYPELNEKLIVTKGRYGCIFKDKLFPVEEVAVKDVSGAGDTFLAALVSEYVKNNDIELAIHFAQLCTTKVVQKHGVSTV